MGRDRIQKAKDRNRREYLKGKMAELKELKRLQRQQTLAQGAPQVTSAQLPVDASLSEHPIETPDELNDNHHGTGGDDEPGEIEPMEHEPNEPPSSSRDLSNLDMFDWTWASAFATSPDEIKAMTPLEEALLLCLNMPGVTRNIWDNGIKRVAQAVASQTLADGREASIGSHKVLIRQLNEGSAGVAPVMVDACRNHCCVFNEERRLEDVCPHCKAKRLDEDDQPHLQTAIFPLRNMLRAILCHQDRARLCVEYRRKFRSEPDQEDSPLTDFWGGHEAKRLSRDGQLLEKDTVLALSVTGDGAEFSASPTRKITPYIALIQNLPPNLRYRYEVPLAIHAGEAKDDSVWRAIFRTAEYELDGDDKPRPLGLWYGEDEFSFAFCFGTGDYPFAASALGLVHQAGRASCRICTAGGYHGERGYYLVNAPPKDDKRPVDAMAIRFPFKNIPCGHSPSAVRTHEGYREAIERKREAGTGTEKDIIRFETGVSAEGSATALVQALPRGVPFHRILPIDPMHAVPLNICKHLLQFITNHGKKYSAYSFCLSEDLQKEFIADLKACTKHIPEELMKRPLIDFTKCSARSEHFLAIGRLAPILLKGRLPAHYVVTFTLLSTIMDCMAEVRTCESDLKFLESAINDFQKVFYRDWYGQEFERVKLCRVYFHAIGHIPDAIRAWGPPFVFAQWAIERFNGKVIEHARLNTAAPVKTTANKISNQFRMDQLLPSRTKDKKDPELGLRNKLSKQHWLLDSREKESLGRYFKTNAANVHIEDVPKYESFFFRTPLDELHRAVAINSDRKSLTRDRHYVWCDRRDVYAKVLCLFEYAGQELAFVELLDKNRVTFNSVNVERCAKSDWSQRLTVMECEDFTQLVAFVESSSPSCSNEMFLIKSMRVYTGEMYKPGSDESGDNENCQ